MIKTTTVEDHRIVCQQLEDLEVEHFTYATRSERPVKILLKYVPIDYSIGEVENDLRTQGIGFHSCAFLTKTTNHVKSKIPLVLVNCVKRSAPALYEIEKICCIDIKVQSYSTNKMAQCYRCQEYGHSSMFCKKMANCVRKRDKLQRLFIVHESNLTFTVLYSSAK